MSCVLCFAPFVLPVLCHGKGTVLYTGTGISGLCMGSADFAWAEVMGKSTHFLQVGQRMTTLEQSIQELADLQRPGTGYGAFAQVQGH